MFDVAVGERAIDAMGHVKMMAAAQPFLSGAISKTVNLPESVTVEDIADVYTEGWKLGLKDEHLPVFDVAVGERAISAMGHVKMMAAAQPFISGAISKTVNLPESVTIEDIA